ncbi:MAG: hypothetical protein HFI75_02610 [Lachnospiraceae bacterium]|nr:hypothetical protein [Lachnospiraceae bacterium]
MTLEEVERMAKDIKYITVDIKSLKKELRELEADRKYYRTSILSDMPKGKGVYTNLSDDFLERQQQLNEMIKYAKKKRDQELKRFNEYLDTIEDMEIKRIIQYRCLKDMHWEEIGELLGMHRTTVSKKYYNFFNVSHNSHRNCGNI